MAKIYGNPVILSGAAGSNADLPPLLDNFKASVPVEGIPVKDMPVGTKIKVPVNADYQSFLGENIVWLVADQNHAGYPANSSTLLSEKILLITVLDAKEPTNPDVYRAKYGNNMMPYANIQQWLNSDGEAGSWYIAQHTYDAPPIRDNFSDSSRENGVEIYNKPGFLKTLPNEFLKNIVESNFEYWDWDNSNTVKTFSSKFTIPSITELGIDAGTFVPTMLGIKFEIFNSFPFTGIYPTQECCNNGNYTVSNFNPDSYWGFWVRNTDDSNKNIASWSSIILYVGANGKVGSSACVNPVNGVVPICNISNETLLSPEPDSDGCYTLAELAPVTIAESDNYSVTLSADKMEESRAEQLAGAVWVYGDHSPANVNDGTKIQLTREECITPSLEGEDVSVNRSIPWSKTKDFYARQFTYNSKKQYQTMLEGAIATLVLTGVPDPVTELAETHSGSSITLTWKNPTSDELYNHTVVVYKTDAFPTTIDDGTQGYSGTDETATLSDLELGTTYYIAVFTVSYIGVYGQPETIQVEIPAGQLLSSLASGTKVKLGKWNNTDLQWKIARDTSDQSIRLVLEPTSVSLLGNMQYDAAEPSNSDSNRKKYGNNRYIYSNIHQWLNATKASNWYTAQHSADAAPAYASSPGFLSGWSENHIAALDRATLTTSRASIDGGGTETFVARVSLISTTELGLQNSTGGGRLDIFNSDGDRATGSHYWTRTPYPSNSYSAYRVMGTGGLSNVYLVNYAIGVRPLCIPKSTTYVSLNPDSDGCYTITGVNE